MKYHPDAWVIVRFSGENEIINKVLAGWYGGYAGCDSWKLSSGISKIELDGDVLHIHNYSGSEYICHRNSERTTGLTGSILFGWREEAEKRIANNQSSIKIELIDFDEFCK